MEKQQKIDELAKHLADAIDILDEIYIAEANPAGQAFLKVKLYRYKAALAAARGDLS